MIRRLLAAFCAGLVALATGWFTTDSAGATPAPTVTAPSIVAYFATVAVTGTTPLPNERVQLFFHSPSTTGYVLRRDLLSDATGHYRTVYSATTAMSFYARAGSVNSAIHLTRLVTATCSVSGPAFRTLPFSGTFADSADPNFAAFTVTRNGLWAGISADVSVGRVAVIAWRPGQTRARVLARITYNGVGWEPASPGSVNVVGIGPSGNIVAAVQRPTASWSRSVAFSGYVWINGLQRRLPARSGWISEQPTGVTRDGTVIGLVTTGSFARPHYLLARWSGDARSVAVVADIGISGSTPVVDGNGDIAFDINGVGRIRRISGVTETLPGDRTVGVNNPIAGGPAGVIYGRQYYSQVRWTVPTGRAAITTTPVAPVDGNHWIVAAGPRGDVIDGLSDFAPRTAHLRTARGAYVTMPATAHVDTNGTPGYAIDEYGRVAFTSARDDLVHILTCR